MTEQILHKISCNLVVFQKEAFHWVDGSPLLHHMDWSKPDVYRRLPIIVQRENFSSVLETRNHLNSNNHKPQLHLEPRHSADNCVASSPVSIAPEWVIVPCDTQLRTRLLCHVPVNESSFASVQPVTRLACMGKAAVIHGICVKSFPVLPENAPVDWNCSDVMFAEQGPLPERLRNVTDMVSGTVCRFAIPKSYCPPSTFMCNDLSCIPLNKHCNNMIDCWAGEDEADCGHMICSTGVGCIDKRCKWPQCTCNRGYFQCEHGGCVSADSMCDGHKNCGDGSDETFCTHALCAPHQMLCADGKMCIDEHQWFDGIDDCLNRSDEFSQVSCVGFMCHDGRCIPVTKQTDGIPDCADAEDEAQYIYDTDGGPMQWSCHKPGYVPCTNTVYRCYLASSRCIYDTDALGNLYSCRRADHLLDCTRFYCRDMFKCPSSYCVPYSRVCDGSIDCQDGADEADCPVLVCPYMFHCAQEKVCIPAAHVCDGKVHCRMSADDERFCQPALCPPHQCVIEQGILDLSNLETYVHLIELRNSSIISITGQSKAEFFATVSIDISHNHLSHLPACLFDKHVALSYLYIRRNKLKLIDPLAFKGTGHLQILDLADNELPFLSGDEVSGLHTVLSLNISGNPIFLFSSFVDEVRIVHSIIHSDDRVCCMVGKHLKCIIVEEHQDSAKCSDLQYMAIVVIGGMVVIALVLTSTIWSLVLTVGNRKKLAMTSLAVSDGLFAFYLAAVAGRQYMYADGKYIYELRGNVVCVVVALVLSVSSQVSLLMLMMIALQSCLINAQPFRARTVFKSIQFSVPIIWIMSVVHQLWPVANLYYTAQMIQTDTTACTHLHGSTMNSLVQLTVTTLFFLIFCIFSLLTALLLKRSIKISPASKNASKLKNQLIWNTECIALENTVLHYLPLITVYFFQVIDTKIPWVVMLAFVLITLPLNKILNALIFNILKSARERKG